MQDMTVVHCRLCAPRVQSIHDCNLHAAGSLFALWSIVFFSMENLNLLLTFILLTSDLCHGTCQCAHRHKPHTAVGKVGKVR